jgi:glycosyltransferase involved in cell wall biosynthesis
MTLADQLAQFQGNAEADRTDFSTEKAAVGAEAHLPWCIELSAHWRPSNDGMAAHSRAIAQALATVGMPVRLKSSTAGHLVLDDDLDPQVAHDMLHLARVSAAKTLCAIHHVVLHSAESLRQAVMHPNLRQMPLQAVKHVLAHTIVYTSWERLDMPDEMVETLNRLGQTWVPCRFNADVFRRAGVQRVHIVPMPYSPSRGASAVAQPRGFKPVPDGKRFYHIGKWEPRKNQLAIIRGFLRAFRPSERASLIVKTHEWGEWDGYKFQTAIPTMLEHDAAIKANGWTPKNFDARVRLIVGVMTADEIVQLHEQNNIYVSASHGEAWDVPAFDAVCAGNMLIYPPDQAYDDYVPEALRHGRLRSGTYDIDMATPEPVHPGYGWGEATWMDCAGGQEDGDVQMLQAAMRRVEPPVERIHPMGLYQRFGMPTVGATALACLKQIGCIPDELVGFGP